MRRITAESLLDTYIMPSSTRGRRPRAARHHSAQTALHLRSDARASMRFGETMAELLLSMDEPRKAVRREDDVRTGHSLCATFGDGHPLLGRRMPDLGAWSPPTARCGSSPCCTTPGLLLLQPPGSLARLRHHALGRRGPAGRRPNTLAHGGASPVLPRCTVTAPAAVLIPARQDMSPGREQGIHWPAQGSVKRFTTWFGAAPQPSWIYR